MKLLILADRFSIGGVETHIMGQIAQLEAQGVETVLCACEQRAAPILDAAVAPLLFHKLIRAGELRALLDDFGSHCTREGFTHIHAHGVFVAIFAAMLAERCGLPFLVTIHGAQDAMRGVNPTCKFLIEHAVLPDALGVDCVSQALLDPIRERAPAARLRVQYNGTSGWTEAASAPRTQRWAFVSRLGATQSAALTHLIAALDHLPIAALDVIGSGESLGELQALAEQQQTPVRFLGWHPEPRRLTRAHDGIAGYGGRTFLEASAAGKPFLICHETGLKGILDSAMLDLAQRENFTGRGLPERDIETLAATWPAACAPQETARVQALVRQRFDEASLWSEYLEAYGAAPRPHPAPWIGHFLQALPALDAANRPFADHHIYTQIEAVVDPRIEGAGAFFQTGYNLIKKQLLNTRLKLRAMKRSASPARTS